MTAIRLIIDRYPTQYRAADACPLGTAGGMSGARFWRLDAPAGPLVLRRWPLESPSPERLAWIHAVLRHAALRHAALRLTAGEEVGLIPLPIATLDGESFVRVDGQLWELSPLVPGEASYFATGRPVAKLRSAMAALASFHLAVADFEATSGREIAPSPGVVRRLDRLRNLQQGGIGQLSEAVQQAVWPDVATRLAEFLTLAEQTLPIVVAALAPLEHTRFALQPCLRDVWHDHVLFVGDEVTGIIDFGAVDVDTPAGDVARLLGSLAEDDPDAWRHGLAAYEELRRLSPDERQAVAALDASGTLLAGCNWARWIYGENRRFDDRGQVVGRVEILTRRLRNLLQRGGTIDC